MRTVLRRGWLGWLGLALLLGCEDPDTVAKVGRTSLTREDVRQLRDSQSPSVRGEPAQTLDALVDRALLAEEARKQKLQEDPALRVRLAAAERELLAQAVLERAVASAVTDEFLRARYEAARPRLSHRELHVAQIFAALPEGSDEAARRQAQVRINQAYARIAGNEPFETVARELSQDTISAPKGGDLGVVREDQVDATFFAQAAGLDVGASSKPFATPFGLHVVKLLEAPRTVVPSFEEARGRLAAEARQEAEAKLLEHLRQEISVRRYPERLERKDDAGTRGSEGESR